MATALHDVRARIVVAAGRVGRDPRNVTLVAVSKTVDAQRVAEMAGLGVDDFGENYVQEAADKIAVVHREGVRWHFIGHLQSNKAAKAATLFNVVQSVDSVRLAETLSAHRPAIMPALSLLIEVELTGLPRRSGVAADSVAKLAAQLYGLPRVSVEGLMTVSAPGDAQKTRSTFACLRQLRDDVQQRTGRALPELSMGMTNDFDIAVEEGATMVRVGRALFGDRPAL